MNLFELFSQLSAPTTSKNSLFNTLTIEEFSFVRIGINNEGFPVLLIQLPAKELPSVKNIRLKHLELMHNTECRISEFERNSISNFTIIILKSQEEKLVRYFLQISEAFIRSLSVRPTMPELLTTFKNFVEIFRVMSFPPTKTVQGLWAELFIIYISENPEVLLNYWHNLPEERFDFNADLEKIEVKSSSNLERIHTFTSDQLQPSEDKSVLVASLFTKQSPAGLSVVDLANLINRKVKTDTFTGKLYTIISQTLGSNVQESTELKFDLELAKNSLRFYRHQDIEKIEKVHIPNKVMDVRFKSDLSSCTPTDLSQLKQKGMLFSAL